MNEETLINVNINELPPVLFFGNRSQLSQVIINYKECFLTGKPYPVSTADEYYSMVQSRRDEIYHGTLGIYLCRKIMFQGQELYFPFIDVDGEGTHGEDQVIDDAIYRTKLTLKILTELGVAEHFFIIASGNTGFRIVANCLLNRSDYLAFVEFVKREMPHIIDLKPTEDLEMPHQLFVYKGNKSHNNKELVDRHSCLISKDSLHYGITPEIYKATTAGKLDPDEVLAFLETFFRFKPISDLKALGKFGKMLQEFKPGPSFKLKTFDITRSSKRPSLSLEALGQELVKKKIIHKIEDRRGKLAISFAGLPCPSCGRRNANARAYPPYFKLKCFSSHCEAYERNGGIPLSQWAGVISGYRPARSCSGEHGLIPQLPAKFSTIPEAHEVILRELANQDNVILLITAGTGKTHVTLDYLVNNFDGKTVIYSCFNRALKEEAFHNVRALKPEAANLYLLQAKEECCLIKDRLNEVTREGFSPGIILCPTCEHRPKCPYYQDRDAQKNGIYFVTHHMLQYLNHKIINPDLLILDENLIGGFRLEDSCSETQMRSLYHLLDTSDSRFLDQILDLGAGLAKEVIMDGNRPQILNKHKLTGDDYQEDYILGVLAKQNEVSEAAIISSAERLVSNLSRHSVDELFKKGVNSKALNWIKGLSHPRYFSYLLITSKGIFFKTKYVAPMPYPQTPIKILDATGSVQVVESLFKRKFRAVQVDVPWPAKLIHIKKSTSRKVMEAIKDKNLTELLQQALNQVSADTILLVTYKFLTARVKKICETLEPGKSFHIHHFQGPRGINTFETCEAVIVLGSPFPNINSGWQDAHILFPGKNQSEVRDTWNDATTIWELIQVIHRIRPVRKSQTEVVLISKSWPQVLPEPENIIDLSYDMHWKELAIQHLELFVQQFGFLNQDIAFLAGVSIKQKENLFQSLRNKFIEITPVLKLLAPLVSASVETLLSQVYFDSDHCVDGRQLPNTIPSTRLVRNVSNLILVIYILYNKNILRLASCISKLTSILGSEIENKRYINQVKLSSPTHWSELKYTFKEKYPYFEEFKIRLPHCKNNYVTGIGSKESVMEFYSTLSELGVIDKKVDFDSYQTLEQPQTTIPSIPAGHLVIFIPENLSGLVYAGYEDCRKVFPIEQVAGWSGALTTILSQENPRIITNQGKYVAKKMLELGWGNQNIHDLMLNEKILANGQLPLNFQNFSNLLERYQEGPGEDHRLLMNKMFRVWEMQQEAIDRDGLRAVVELENQVLWVVAGMELRGIRVDADRLANGLILCQEKLTGLREQLNEIFPPELDAGKENDQVAFLNQRFGLGLKDRKDETLKSVTDPRAQEVIGLILKFRGLHRLKAGLERLWENAGIGDRIQVSTSQIGTVTGRITSTILQTLPKAGPLRSLIIPREGYKFVIADYSQFEARIALGLSRDKHGLAIFKGGKDIYREFAGVITGKSEGEVGEFRKVSKGIVLGLLNGKTEYSIHADLGSAGIDLSLDDVKGLIEKFHGYFSGLKSWQDRVVDEALTSGYAKTALGRRRYLDQVVEKSNARNRIKNFPIQGTAADGFKIALCRLDNKFQELGLDAHLVLTLHDEIVVEAREYVTGQVGEVVEECLKEAFMNIVPGMPFELDMRIAEAWVINP